MYTPSSKVSTLTVAVATLSVNKMKMMVWNVHSKVWVSTLTFEGATRSVHEMKMTVGFVYTKLYWVDTSDNISSA